MIPNSPTAAAGRYPGLPLPELRRAAKNGFHPQGAALGFPVAALDAGADTISSVEYVNGQLWGTLSSSMKDGSGNKIKVVDYFAFTPQITNGKLSASLFTQRVIAQRGLFLMYPAIALNTDGNGAIVFSFSGPNDYPTAAFVSVEGTSVNPIDISREGQEPDDGFTFYPPFSNLVGRWGDYSAAAVNNVDNTIWMATEYSGYQPNICGKLGDLCHSFPAVASDQFEAPEALAARLIAHILTSLPTPGRVGHTVSRRNFQVWGPTPVVASRLTNNPQSQLRPTNG